MAKKIHVTAFYKFTKIPEQDLEKLRSELAQYGEDGDMRGLALLATEGLNGTVCGTPKVIQGWKDLLKSHFGEIMFKDSFADDLVYSRWYVKIRPEIVTLRDPDVHPDGHHNHLTPEEWDRVMEQEDVVVLDTRNDYETEIGVFEGAVDPKLTNFQEFPDYIASCSIPKEKKVLMYCTGGIRCEKALLEMEKQGYSNVYQLEGGILAYMKQFPHKKFKGECFVFDHRVSVDQELKPSSRYHLCPHCGDPGDVRIDCALCSKRGWICERCEPEAFKTTCSKDCAYRMSKKSVPTTTT